MFNEDLHMIIRYILQHIYQRYEELDCMKLTIFSTMPLVAMCRGMNGVSCSWNNMDGGDTSCRV